jgi:hypothetical protein
MADINFNPYMMSHERDEIRSEKESSTSTTKVMFYFNTHVALLKTLLNDVRAHHTLLVHLRDLGSYHFSGELLHSLLNGYFLFCERSKRSNAALIVLRGSNIYIRSL